MTVHVSPDLSRLCTGRTISSPLGGIQAPALPSKCNQYRDASFLFAQAIAISRLRRSDDIALVEPIDRIELKADLPRKACPHSSRSQFVNLSVNRLSKILPGAVAIFCQMHLTAYAHRDTAPQ